MTERYIFKSTRQGLPKTRNGIIKNELVFNEKKGLDFNKEKGLKNITKHVDIDELFEFVIADEIDLLFKMSPDEREFRNNVYIKFGPLFYNNSDAFNNRMDMIKHQNTDTKLTKEDVTDELKDIYYQKKHPYTNRNKQSKKFQYKKELKPLDEIKR